MANHRKATGGGRVYASRGQLFGVGVLFVGAAAVIFFFGILIGQSIEERKLRRKGEAGVTVSVTSEVRDDDPEMTFYETLTQPAPPGAGAPASSPPTDGVRTPWTVQVAATETRSRADHMAANLRQRGYKAYVTAAQLDRRTFYRVRVGRYRSRQEALADFQQLKQDKHSPMIVETE